MTERWLEDLSQQACLELLRANAVGRIGIVQDGWPIVLPINYRLVEDAAGPLLMLRTRPGNAIDTAGNPVAFEVDGIDPSHRRGWSVLVQGVLRHVHAESAVLDARFDSDTWIAEDRTTFLTIEPTRITGRRLIQPTVQWAFHQSAYL